MSDASPAIDSAMPAIVIAGGRLEGEFAERTGTTVKALATVSGVSLISTILTALRSAPRVGTIVIVGPRRELSDALILPPATMIIEEGGTGPENVQRGLRFLADSVHPAADRVLVCTSDMPFVTAESIEKMIDLATLDSDIVYPVVERSVYEAAFPESPNTFARLAGREYTGGGVLIVRPAALAANAALIETVFRARKSQFGMAKLLGLNFLLRYLTGSLTIHQAEARATQITGCACRALVGAPVEVSADVDSIADYAYANWLSAADSNLRGSFAVYKRTSMKPLLDPFTFNESLQEARQRASEIGRDAQERAGQIVREAQERALELARQRAAEAQERARRAAESMPPGLLVRLTSSMLGIPLLFGLVFAEGPPQYAALPFTCAVAICALLGGWEYFRALRLRGFAPSEGPAYAAIVLLQFVNWSVSRFHAADYLPALIALLVIGTLIHQILRRDPEPVANVGVTFLGVVYVGWLFSYLIFLRSLPGHVHISALAHFSHGLFNAAQSAALAGNFLGSWIGHIASGFSALSHAAWGTWMVLYVFAVTWSTDAGAYFFGMRFGKHKLAPSLSPKKTVEGAIGGLLAATLMSLLWGAWIGVPWYHCLILGPMLGALGQVGDLCESALKRDLGIKDFGTILPGHGGILDRFDSLFFTAPIAYYYVTLILPRL